MDLNKENKLYWNVETTPINEIAYKILLNNTKKINEELARKNDDKRTAYMTLDDFIYNIEHFKPIIEEANIYLRKEKIKKLKI